MSDQDDSTLPDLRLAWPTDYVTERTHPAYPFTQRFGANPQLYAKFGLAGHEGVDIRAPSGSNVYAAAAGVVTMAGWHPRIGRRHAYGLQIRIRHRFLQGEYETIYAHLREGELRVQIGDEVTIRQLIALSDETGNVLPRGARGAHLHFGLKRIGAAVPYGDLINPEPVPFNGLPSAKPATGPYRDLIDPEPFFVDLPGQGTHE